MSFQKFVDISGTDSENGDIILLTGDDAIIESVKNILMTEPNTKIYTKRDFGTKLKQFLFEPVDQDTAIDILNEVQEKINKYERRISGLNVEIQPLEDQYTFRIIVEFKTKLSLEKKTLQFILNKIR